MTDKLKEAFAKVKQDILNLQSQISLLTKELSELKRTLNQTDRPTNQQTDLKYIQTEPNRQTDNQTVPHEIRGLNHQNFGISIGSEGVQTDRPTNQQTDRQTQKFALNQNKSDNIENIEKVAELVNSLDELKKDLRKQFKKLTSQEMLVFTTIYLLGDEGLNVDYHSLAERTNLSESSIRDYIQKLIQKGIPIRKSKENNKKVTLTIPAEFKRMANLQTIISLRNL